MKIVFTGGGTAGHIFPILAIIRELRNNYSDPDLDLYYFGPKNLQTEVLLSIEKVKIKTIPSGKIRRYFAFQNFIDFFKIPCGILKAIFLLFFLAPDMVFSKGGYGSFATALAAFLLRVPIFVHESDATIGFAAKIESKWAVEIFTSFEETFNLPTNKIVCVGNPIRSGVMGGNKEDALKFFEIQSKKPVLFVLGGSQGAASINNLILETFPEILSEFEVIHQTGETNYQQNNKEAYVLIGNEQLRKSYHSFGFMNETQLKNGFAACDLVISRAGSGAIFEISANKKPAILIPLSNSAQNHQVHNAYCFEKCGGGEVLEEDNLKPHLFLEKLNYLFGHPNILQAMVQGSENFSRPKAARMIANYLLEYLYRSFVPIEGQ
ncbi:UDP-N-acetylglucosamine--N-acetylmuramyl-(pentapeptide) pyrophosphoryl-undecaprenol N-acetylglucosamine transferase [bacterium (Candidatus Gribaldobacteria) CG08_land_8_20_14_0_20_39_15]|uniref:UDP-N-acetylglucosamine--N-acetylmuramyl-(pentapeptide) pyrophosphoryl-undecaprenol N-acetylglucosamine transferase n=1 Tax=bacterium (Candidatus Gribaldobacteria) CG08_land_8_20_14_0_20_39_15 TaxID=2014273 RepID=A0A2M6XUB1_9BACT|nr:MAG: UDP-N-acetylglucosamine--N-acetylmuramyl-(pentapeptide) pyrophosphoryl-undecaprenol N-acetylglucosamine transferase [bacterium (Candidatus Gribaldobacteria) CG08_land_8_20_14_0_20_39_15]